MATNEVKVVCIVSSCHSLKSVKVGFYGSKHPCTCRKWQILGNSLQLAGLEDHCCSFLRSPSQM